MCFRDKMQYIICPQDMIIFATVHIRSTDQDRESGIYKRKKKKDDDHPACRQDRKGTHRISTTY